MDGINRTVVFSGLFSHATYPSPSPLWVYQEVRMHGCESVGKQLLDNSLQLRQRQLGWHGPACAHCIRPLSLCFVSLQQVNLQGLIANMNGLYIGASEGLQCFARRV